MDNLTEIAKTFLKNKEARKVLPVLRLFTKDPVALAMIAGIECACAEFDKLCPTGEC